MSFRPGWAPSDVQNEHSGLVSPVADNCVTIQKLLSGSAYDGYFKMDDRVVAINGCNVVGLTLSDVLNVSKRCGDLLTLTIQRKPVVDDYETRRQQRRRSRQPTNPDSDNSAQYGIDVANRDQTNIVVRSLSRSQSAHPESDRKVSASPAPSRFIASPDNSPNVANYGSIVSPKPAPTLLTPAYANVRNNAGPGYAPLHSSTVTVLPRCPAPQNDRPVHKLSNANSAYYGPQPSANNDAYGTLPRGAAQPVRSRAPSEVEQSQKYQPSDSARMLQGSCTNLATRNSAAPYQSAHVQHLSAVKDGTPLSISGDFVYVSNEPKATPVVRNNVAAPYNQNAAMNNSGLVRPAQQRRVISQSVIDLSSQGRPQNEQKPAWLAQTGRQNNFTAATATQQPSQLVQRAAAQNTRTNANEFDAASLCDYSPFSPNEAGKNVARTRAAEPNATRLYQIVANERARPPNSSGYLQPTQNSAASDRMTLCASQF